MDLRLPLLADINLHLGVAEEAIVESDYLLAKLHLEKAEESFAELEESPSGEALFQALLAPLEERARDIRADILRASPDPRSEKQDSSGAAS